MSSPSTDIRGIRRFGLISTLICAPLVTLSLWRDNAVTGFIFSGLGLLGLGFLILPGLLSPLYRAWLKTSTRINQLMTMIILTTVYFTVLTPTAWLKRFFGGRPLPTAPDRGASSYWVSRSEPAQPKERFIKRY